MKKLGLLALPLMTISFLVGCANNDKPEPQPEPIPETETYNVKFNITDCIVSYDGKVIGEDGVDIIVPKNTDPHYVKFSVSPTEEAIIDPVDVVLDQMSEYAFNRNTGDLIINLQTNLNIMGRWSLEECSWATIKEISEAGKGDAYFNVGDTKDVIVNEIHQPVRIIGFNHDELSSSTEENLKFAGITFEFVNLISDSDGYSLATPWDWRKEDKTTNEDYLNSNLRKAIDGLGDGDTTLSWYQKGADAQSKVYTMPVIDMIPSEIQKLMEEVKKPIFTETGSTVSNYNTKLFPLSYKEAMNDSEGLEGSTYEIYKEGGNKKRLKHQIKWHEDAETTFTPIVTGGYIGASNYAGYNSPTESYGGYYWFRSPNPGVFTQAFNCGFDGGCGENTIYKYAFAVAPAFCV